MYKLIAAVTLAVILALSGHCQAAGPNPPAYVPFELATDWIKGYQRGVTGTGPNTGPYDFRLQGIAQELPTASGVKWLALMAAQLEWSSRKAAYMDGYNNS